MIWQHVVCRAVLTNMNNILFQTTTVSRIKNLFTQVKKTMIKNMKKSFFVKNKKFTNIYLAAHRHFCKSNVRPHRPQMMPPASSTIFPFRRNRHPGQPSMGPVKWDRRGRRGGKYPDSREWWGSGVEYDTLAHWQHIVCEICGGTFEQ